MARHKRDGKPVDPDFNPLYQRPKAWKSIKAAARGAVGNLDELLLELEKLGCPRVGLACAVHAYLAMSDKEQADARADWLRNMDGGKKKAKARKQKKAKPRKATPVAKAPAAEPRSDVPTPPLRIHITRRPLKMNGEAMAAIINYPLCRARVNGAMPKADRDWIIREAHAHFEKTVGNTNARITSMTLTNMLKHRSSQ